MQHRGIMLLALLSLLAACAPSEQDCQHILPVVSEPVTVTTTPTGTPGCACLSEGVLVVAEAHRSGFSWVRGALWVDGTSVSEQDFPARLAQVKTQRQVEATAAQVRGVAQGVVAQARKAFAGLLHH